MVDNAKRRRPKVNYKAFAEWVIRRRKDLDLTQEELANRAGCEKAYISKLENASQHPIGRKPPSPSLDFLYRLSRALGASMADPLMALGYIKRDSSNSEPHIVRLLHYYNALPREEQKLAEDLVKTLWQHRAPHQEKLEPGSKKKRA